VTALVMKRSGDAGPPLVLVHGYLGGAALWDGQMQTFSDSFCCIAPNLAGFGDSAHIDAPETIEGHARMVIETLTQIGVETFHLLGHSMGGMVVQQMAAMVPDRVKRLVLYGTGPVGMLPDRFETIDVSRERLQAEGLQATAARIAATWFEKGVLAERYPICLAEGRKATLQAALASLSAWERWDGSATLASLPMPSLVIWGDGDRSYGWSQPERLWRTIPHCRLAVVPGCGHIVHLEKPDIFNAIVKDFLVG
jgi:pimeloyl-ACP methyl ester carboxylesterase